MRLSFLLCCCVALSLSAMAEKKTVCTITVNSSDEKESFRQNLPKDKYSFVELVEKGRDDWLASSCRKGIQDRKSTRLNSSHIQKSRMPSSA